MAQKSGGVVKRSIHSHQELRRTTQAKKFASSNVPSKGYTDHNAKSSIPDPEGASIIKRPMTGIAGKGVRPGPASSRAQDHHRLGY